MSLPLLQTKLYAPRRPARTGHRAYVQRPRLTRCLDAALLSKLTLIAAPAGFGKSTLLAEWIATNSATTTEDNLKFCWLSLDAGDNDPVRFWRYVIAALQSVQPEAGATALALLQAPQPPPVEAALTPLINELAAWPDLCVLVLDDYHLIETPAIHTTLTFLLEHWPPSLHLILSTRSDPPLPLARWRGRGQLTEIRADDLRFTPDETAAFLQEAMGLALAEEEVTALEAHTEGWITGLQLAALSLHEPRDRSGFIAAFTSSNRYVVDYLVEEVLQQQPPAIEHFLLQTSALAQLSGPLCDAVLGQTDSQNILVQLERSNLFLIPLDNQREWYRYHHFFADALYNRLQEAQPQLLPDLHRRAARWLAQHEWLSLAIEHALAAPDFALAAQLIEAGADPLLRRGEHNTVERWLTRLPLAELDRYPPLLLLHANVLLLRHDLERATRDLAAAEVGLQQAEPHRRQRILGEVAALRSHIASLQDDLPRAVTLAQEALTLLPAEDRQRRGEIFFRLGVAHAWQGQVDAASVAFAEAQRLAVATGDQHTAIWAMINVGAMQSTQGYLPQALALQQETLTWAATHDARQAPILSLVHTELARLYYEFNDLTLAEQHSQEAIRAGARSGLPRVVVDGHILMAMVQQARRDPIAAQQAMSEAEALIERYHLPLRYRGFAARIKLGLALANGDHAAAMHWRATTAATITDAITYPRQEELMALAQVLVALGDYPPAIVLLTRLHEFAEAGGWFQLAILMLALKARAQYLLGDQPSAYATLEQALRLAVPNGFVRAFVDQGDAMRFLLLGFRFWLAQQAPAEQYIEVRQHIEQLLNAFDDQLPTAIAPVESASTQNPKLVVELSKSKNPADLLSEREVEVLRLLVNGATNQEIAEQLIVSLNTIKRHVSNIFNKLGVNNRLQAVTRARARGIID